MKVNNSAVTQERGTDVLGDLVARAAGFREMAQLLVQHAFELQRENNKGP